VLTSDCLTSYVAKLPQILPTPTFSVLCTDEGPGQSTRVFDSSDGVEFKMLQLKIKPY